MIAHRLSTTSTDEILVLWEGQASSAGGIPSFWHRADYKQMWDRQSRGLPTTTRTAADGTGGIVVPRGSRPAE